MKCDVVTPCTYNLELAFVPCSEGSGCMRGHDVMGMRDGHWDRRTHCGALSSA